MPLNRHIKNVGLGRHGENSSFVVTSFTFTLLAIALHAAVLFQLQVLVLDR